MTNGERVSPDRTASPGSDAAPSVSPFLNVCGAPGGQHSSGSTFGLMDVTVSTGFFRRTLGPREPQDVCVLDRALKRMRSGIRSSQAGLRTWWRRFDPSFFLNQLQSKDPIFAYLLKCASTFPWKERLCSEGWFTWVPDSLKIGNILRFNRAAAKNEARLERMVSDVCFFIFGKQHLMVLISVIIGLV